MADTTFGTNDPLTVTAYSRALALEYRRKAWVQNFIGKGDNFLINEVTDLKKGKGDKIKCGLRIQMDGRGIVGDDTLEGSEEALQYFDDQVTVNQLRHAARSKGRMSDQRTAFDFREEARNGLADWWIERDEVAFFNQVCGNTAESDTAYTGLNAVAAPSANRHIWQGGNSDDESLGAADTFTLDLIDGAREKAESASTKDGTGPLIRPIMHEGQRVYVMFLHDFQVTALRTHVSATEITWYETQKQAMAGGDVKGNPIFNGALGMYNGVILHKSKFVTQGVDSSTGAAIPTVRRAVLCGAQAATIAYGDNDGPMKYNWHETSYDHGNKASIAAGRIFGMKKTKFIPKDDSDTNAEDFGTVVVSTHAAAFSTA